MKKIICVALSVMLLALCGCSTAMEGKKTYEDGYHDGYEKGCEDGYEEAIDEADARTDEIYKYLDEMSPDEWEELAERYTGMDFYREETLSEYSLYEWKEIAKQYHPDGDLYYFGEEIDDFIYEVAYDSFAVGYYAHEMEMEVIYGVPTEKTKALDWILGDYDIDAIIKYANGK